MAQRQLIRTFMTTVRMSAGEAGSGAGKGGGSGGSIRDAGGAFGKLEAAREEEYFHKLKQAQLKELRSQVAREAAHHEQQAKHHADVVARHKRRLDELAEEEKNLKK